MHTPQTESEALNRAEASTLLGVSATTFWRLGKEDPKFPRPVTLRGARRWLRGELLEWLRRDATRAA